jgi:hypothetical protein
VREDPVDHGWLGDERDHPHRVAAPRTAERVDLEDPPQQLRPAAAHVGLRGRHHVGCDHRGLLVEAGLAPDAAGPVGIPAIVTLEHLAFSSWSRQSP